MELRYKEVDNEAAMRLAVYGGIFSRFHEEFEFDKELPVETEERLLDVGIRAKIEKTDDGLPILHTQELVHWNAHPDNLGALHDMHLDFLEEYFGNECHTSRWWVGSASPKYDDLMADLSQKIVSEG